MGRWLLHRCLAAGATTLAAGLLLIVLVHSLPGDPLTAALEHYPATPDQIAELRRVWGVDRSLPEVVLGQLRDLARGSLGHSLSQDRAVTTILAERLGPTLLLGTLTLLTTMTLGVLLGVWSAFRSGQRRALAVNAMAIIGYAVPALAVGTALVWLFAVELRWLPSGGLGSSYLPSNATRATRWLDAARHVVLPLATMVIATIAVPLRQQRSATLDALGQGWVLAARARGISGWRLAWQHAWRPALSPIITLLGLWLPMLVAGAVVVEKVFAWPGVGTLIADATAARDLPLVTGAGLLLVVMVQLGSLLADLLGRVLIPTTRPPQ